eukprot:Seg4907.1 transcript_id=Seg4907.1/GoldUCD/mRNA.D3Y31 product="Protein atonal 8" protein_id=Seg4907.1/GoldUCD/D3Y31
MAGEKVGEFKTAKSKPTSLDGDVKSNVVIKKAKNLRNGLKKNSSEEIIEAGNSTALCLGIKNDMKKKIKVIKTKNLRTSKTSDVKRKKCKSELVGRVGRRSISEIEDNKDSCNGDVTMHNREKDVENIVTGNDDFIDYSGRDGAEKSSAAELVNGKDSCNVDIATNYRWEDARSSVTDNKRQSNMKRKLAVEIKGDRELRSIDFATNYPWEDAKNSVTDDGRNSNMKRTLVAEIKSDADSCNGAVPTRYREKGVNDSVADPGAFSKNEVHRMKIKGIKDIIVCESDEVFRDDDVSMCRKESVSCEGDAACRRKERKPSAEPNITDKIKVVKNRGRLQNCKSTAKSKVSPREVQEVASGKRATKRRNVTKAEENSAKYSKNSETSSANNTQLQRRILANARERTRVHKLSEAFDLLRSAIPSYTADQKLSKLSILRIAISYISALGCLVDCEKSSKAKRMFAVSVDNCTMALQSEFGRAKGARRFQNAIELDNESLKDS